jgi:hypothetical protein
VHMKDGSSLGGGFGDVVRGVVGLVILVAGEELVGREDEGNGDLGRTWARWVGV